MSSNTYIVIMCTYLTNYCVHNIYLYDRRMYNSETILLRYNMINNILYIRVKRIFKTQNKYYNYDFPVSICTTIELTILSVHHLLRA